jgi:GTP cyclohydrolase IA
MNHARVQELTRELLIELGEDPTRDGLGKTPERVARSYEFLVSGYEIDPAEVLRSALFQQDTNNMVIARDIEIYSLCEHHMLPFFGRCHIGYIPRKGTIVGISKLARVADIFARRLQVQERLTEQIARCLVDTLGAEGVGVVIEARHLCMMMRGVEKQNSLMVTSSVLGSFHSSASTRAEFMALVGHGK